MKILSLEVADYDRLELSGIKNIKFNSFASITAFLGTNGSGKSSLLHLLSALPADRADFGKDGYVIIRIEENGVIYRLTSDFRKGAMYSFIVENNDEELNEGGTQTAQRQLVTHYFKYSNMIHSLLIGDEDFTEMSPKRRKDWFTLLCDCDYTYAIGAYNRIKEKQRDTTGALKKHQQLLLAATTTEEQSDESVENIQKTISHLNDEIEEINRMAPYDQKFQGGSQDKELKEFLESKTNILEGVAIANIQNTIAIAKGLIKMADAGFLQQQVSETQGRIVSTEETLKNKVEQHLALRKRLESVKISNEDENALRVSRIQALENDIIVLKQSAPKGRFTLPMENAEEVWSGLNNNADFLAAISQIVAVGVSPDLRDRLKKTDEDLIKTNASIADKRAHFARIEGVLETHARKVEEHKATCPDCQHTFLFKVGQENLTQLHKSKDALSLDLGKEEDRKEKLTEEFNYLNERVQILNHFNSFITGNPVALRPYIKVVMGEQLLYENPYALEGVLKEYLMVAQIQLSIREKENIIKEESKLLSGAKTVDARYYEQMVEELTLSEKQIEHQTEQLSNLREMASYYNNQLESIKKVISVREDLKNRTEHVKELLDFQMRKAIYNEAQVLISSKRENISLLSKRMTEILSRENKIKDLEKTITELEIELQSWTALEASLSPTDGAIAQGLLGYIKIFISRLNGFIGQIWTYPLVVMASTTTEEENNDLSYRFPILVGDTAKQRKDVKMGSSGIKEVINLAFRITAMRALGLSGYPIFLDEFGRTFDEKHRERAARLIDQLVEEFKEDQIFMVSHFYQQYSVMNDVVYCVIKEDNIVLPPNNVNKDIEIVR